MLLLIGAPVVWLLLLQTNYVLTYAACAARSSRWLHAASAVAVVAAAALAALAWLRRRGPGGGTDSFLADVALLITLLFAIVVIATAVPPLALHPCD